MANITVSKFDRDGLELYVDESTGLAYAPISATARLCGCEPIQVKRVLSGDTKSLESSVVKTSRGDRKAKLLTSEQVYDVALEFNKDLARKMGAAGANVFMCGLAGYQVAIATKPKSALELAREQVRLLEQIELQEAQIKLLEADNERQAEVIDELFEYSSIIRVAKYNGCSEKAFQWHKLKAASKALNVEIKKVPCPRYGEKNLYSHDAWRLAYPGYRLPETTTLVINQPNG